MQKEHLPPPGLEGPREKVIFEGPETVAILASAHTMWGCSEGVRATVRGGLGLELQVRCRYCLLTQEMKSSTLAFALPPPASVQPVHAAG